METQLVWGGLVAWYLFLAGLGAGAYFVSALADFLGKKDKTLTKGGVFLGAPLVAIGSLLLIADLGMPQRFLLTFLRPGSSMISIGVIIITVFIIIGFIHLFFMNRLSRGLGLFLGTIGMIFAVATAVYTGLLLGVVKAIPFWNTPILPILFLVSALSTGIGLLILVRAIYRYTRRDKEEAEALASFHLMGRSDMVLIGLELLVLLFLFIIMFSSTTVAAESAGFLLSGGYALIFWLGVVFIGLIVPLVLEAVSVSGTSLSAVSSIGIISGICLLVGGLLLRYSILAAGVTLPLN